MQCPRCNIELSEGVYEDEFAAHCSSCGGVLIKQKSLTRILTRLSRDIFEAIDFNIPIPSVPDPGQVESCPCCANTMENYGYMESKTVMLDYCESCNALWIDALELASMAKMFVASKKHLQHLKDTEYQGVDLFGAYAYSMAVSGAFLLGIKI